jgi:hypothetical protein
VATGSDAGVVAAATAVGVGVSILAGGAGRRAATSQITPTSDTSKTTPPLTPAAMISPVRDGRLERVFGRRV